MYKKTELFMCYINELKEHEVRYNRMYEYAYASLKKTVGEPIQLRKAKAIANILDSVELCVMPYEKITGTILGMWPHIDNTKDSNELFNEACKVINSFKAKKHENTDKSRRYAFIAADRVNSNITHKQYQDLLLRVKEEYKNDPLTNPQEIGRELDRYFNFDYGDYAKLLEDLPWISSNHLNLNYSKIVKIGLKGILESIQIHIKRNCESKNFYEAALLTFNAVRRFILRYVDVLIDKSKCEEDHARSKELKLMADICKKISFNKPETFREALQLVWMIHTIGNMCGGGALSFARFDQYMYPFYKKDIDDNRLSREEAGELVSHFWLKVNEPKIGTVQSICLGGLTKDDYDGANDLSKLCLEVARSLKTPYPNISVRVNKKSPSWLYNEIIETISAGFGQPMVLNDEMWIRNLIEIRGHSWEHAIDYYNMGCVEIMIEGKQPNWAGCGGVDFPGIIELVFNSGIENMAGVRGTKTNDIKTLITFDDFMDAYKGQMNYLLSQIKSDAYKKIEERKDSWYDSLGSLFVDDCITKGKDIFQGGTVCEPVRAIGGFGLGTAVDSLAAIRKFVYKEKSITLTQLKKFLTNNYKGSESIRNMLENMTPAFGNDIEEVDDIASEIFDQFTNQILSFNDGGIYGRFAPVFFSYTRHVNMGELIAATPNGRKAAQPISDAIGPSQGKDILGPTKLINSILKLDHTKISGGYAFNLKLNGSLTNSSQGKHAIKTLMTTYFERGGLQMQINYVDADILKEAQKFPDKHKGLVVRVAGFCEYFSNLDRDLQNEIINRTEHKV